MKKIMLFAAFIVFSMTTFAQTEAITKTKSPTTKTTNDFLKSFLGTWKGAGKVMGLESKIDLVWETVLDGKFVKISSRIEMKKKDGGTQIFEGVAYYKAIDEQKYQGNWFDSGGDALPIDARIEGNALNALWGTEETKLGRTIYRLVDEKNMEVVDSIRLKDGTWREFGRVVYVRSSL